MNQDPDRKLVTLLFNPFVYVAGAKALLIGLGAIVVAGLIGAVGHTHFDGVLDVHSGADARLWFFLAEGISDWLCLALVLLVLGKLVSRTAFRAVDVLGTQALARWPTIFVALVTLPGGFRRFGVYLVDRVLKPEANPQFKAADAAAFCLGVAAIVILTCWLVVLMYKAYSVSCNLRGGKAIGTFLGGLVLAEVLSKVALAGLLSLGSRTPMTITDANAVSAAQSWLSQIDEGNYALSWEEAAPLFQAKVSEQSWGMAMNSARKPLGSLVSRKLQTSQPATQLPGAPDGQYLVLQFDTAFKEKKAAVETVTVGLEKDGTWRASGYYIK